MKIGTRELEEDEAKIDNLLHKVLNCARRIEELNNQIDSSVTKKYLDAEYAKERTKKIDLLIRTIEELVMLADDIDITDETITEGIENDLKIKLNRAILDIKEVDIFLNENR